MASPAKAKTRPTSERDSVPDATTLREVIRRIVEVADPEQIILFGSAARGHTGPHSDLDLLVVKSGAHRLKLAGEIYCNMRGFGHPVDIVVVTPEDVERYRNSFCLVIYPALREGRIIYEKSKAGSDPGSPNAPRVAEETASSSDRKFPPDDARAWIENARSDLALAKAHALGVYLEHRCFHLQQAAEKAIKAVCIKRGVPFPYTHELAGLFTALENSGELIPASLRRADELSPYAIVMRYPGFAEPVTDPQYREAVELAEAVLLWAKEIVQTP